ncbi:MAG: helix-turn-helix domain-containing protein [Pseudomonadota bacterium]
MVDPAAPKLRCASCPIRERAVCSTCDADELKTLDRVKNYRTYPAGVEIIGAGETAAFVGSVVTGVVKLTKTMVDGRRQMVGLLFPSDFLGRYGGGRADCDAVAATDVTLCQFERAPFEALLASTPSLEQRLLQMTMDELDAAREWLLLLGRKTAREKVASFLEILARRTATNPESPQIHVPLSREDMADYLGLTIETVSRQMSALKKEGVINVRGARDVEIRDRVRLIEESGEASW